MSTRKSMTRREDYPTSEAAADSVERATIRGKVLAFAETNWMGFIDDDLRALDPGAPESSFRKRRTELMQDGLIVATDSTRLNKHGKDATVFVHRKFHPNPPPIIVKVPGKAAAAIRRSKREKMMYNALVAAAPHHQGGHSRVGEAIAEALGIPFPIRVTEIPAPLPL